MRTFDYTLEYERLLTPEIVACLVRIHEYKVQMNLFMEEQKDVLGELMEAAKLQSVEASNHIEGIITSDGRLKMIVLDKTIPKNKSERDIAGYRDVLSHINEGYAYISIRPSEILQLHQDLYRYSGSNVGGNYKKSDNIISEELTDNIKSICFQFVSPLETSEAMSRLCKAWTETIGNEIMDRILLIPMFVLDFLCIHPFNYGDVRMSQLLTSLLLYRAGYIVGQYISIEKLIADGKEVYFDAIQNSSKGWYEENNDYLPFVQYFLNVITDAYREFQNKIGILTIKGLSKPDRVRKIIQSTTGRITKSEIIEKCPDISMITVQRALADMLSRQEIIKIGGGRYTSYTWNWEKK